MKRLNRIVAAGLAVLVALVLMVTLYAGAWLIKQNTPVFVPKMTKTQTPVMMFPQFLFRQPHDNLDPQWSPDGQKLAFVGHAEGNPDVFMFDVSTGGIKNLSHAPEDDFNPIWSPDSKYVLFYRREGHNVGPNQLVVVRADSGESRVISGDYGYIPQDEAFWSADSQFIFYRKDASVHRYTVEDHLTQPDLTADLPDNRLRASYAPVSYMKPIDNSTVLVITFNTLAYSDYYYSDVSLVTLTTNKVEILAAVDLVQSVAVGLSGLAFTAWTGDRVTGDGPWRVYYMDFQQRDKLLSIPTSAKDQGQGTLSVSYSNSLHWSCYQGGLDLLRATSDGRWAWVIFNCHQDTDSTYRVNSSIELFDPATGQTCDLLTVNVPIKDIAWSPTRDQLAFNTYAGIYVTDVPTGEFRDFIQGGGRIWEMTWSSDGNYIVSGLGGNWDLSYSEIAAADVRDGTIYRYQSGALDSGKPFLGGELQWRPDDDSFTFLGGDLGKDGVFQGSVYRVDLPSALHRALTF